MTEKSGQLKIIKKEESISEKKFSRRSFLQLTSVLTAGLVAKVGEAGGILPFGFFKSNGGVAASRLYVDDVFSTYTYTGTNAVQTISNGIGLASTASWSAYSLTTGTNANLLRVTTDSLGNFYSIGYMNDGSHTYVAVNKYSSTGVLAWQRNLKQLISEGCAIAVDSSGNVHVTGNAQSSGDYIIVAKYDSSGTLLWQRKLQDGASGKGKGIAVDASGNVYVTGQAYSMVSYALVTKYNSSGVLQWQRALTGASSAMSWDIACDTNGVYVCGQTNDGSSDYGFLAKYNFSGVIQWQRTLGASGINLYAYSLALDSSGNILISGFGNQPAQLHAYVAKYNSSGVLQWQKSMKQGSGSCFSGVATDASNNVYTTGYTNSGSTAIVAKYNSAGTIQWQRTFSDPTSVTLRSICTGTDGSVVVGGTYFSSKKQIVIKFLQDGTTTSGQALVTMSSGSATDAASGFTDAAGALGETVAGAVDSAGGATDTAGLATLGRETQALVATSPVGMVWIKNRSRVVDHGLYDTIRGPLNGLQSDLASGQSAFTNTLTGFHGAGFSLGADSSNTVNLLSDTYSSWTFKKAAKFFDVVTYTGDGTLNRQIAHSLGVTPGMVMLKRTDGSGDWFVWHRGLTVQKCVYLNATNVETPIGIDWSPSATTFTATTQIVSNTNGQTYVAYLFAHDVSANGIIECGSFTSDGSGQATVSLGWEPQFVMTKSINSTYNWAMMDSTREFAMGNSMRLHANNTDAEQTGVNEIYPTATGFKTAVGYGSGINFIYVAIRRPNKPPTYGTQVYEGVQFTGSAPTPQFLGTMLAPDICVQKSYLNVNSQLTKWYDRLRGSGRRRTASGSGSVEAGNVNLTAFSNGMLANVGSDGEDNPNATVNFAWLFKRYPKVLDMICYTGTGATLNLSHNLTVQPELWLVAARSANTHWEMGSTSFATNKFLRFTDPNGLLTDATIWDATNPTSSILTVGNQSNVNTAATTYFAYLFATLAGVSKVGTYTGNGSSQTINCAFTTGARFIMILRTDTTQAGAYTWDSTRGIVAGNDPWVRFSYLTSAQTTNDDSVDPDVSGFVVNQVAATNINVTSATYIFLAIS